MKALIGVSYFKLLSENGKGVLKLIFCFSFCFICGCCHCGLEMRPLHTHGTPDPDEEKEEDKGGYVQRDLACLCCIATGAWMVNMADSVEKERADWRKSQRQKERELPRT